MAVNISMPGVIALLNLMDESYVLDEYPVVKKINRVRLDKHVDLDFQRQSLNGKYKVVKTTAEGIRIKLFITALYKFEGRNDFPSGFPSETIKFEKKVEGIIKFNNFVHLKK